MADATSTEPGLGLLQGVDVKTALKYSETLTYSEDLLRSEGFFWAAAEADAHAENVRVEDYLTSLTTKLYTFMSSDYVFGRDDLKEGIRELIEKKASISIVLGANDIGKTKILNAISTEFTGKNKSDVLVVYVNARDHATGSLADGIRLALSRLDKLKFFKDMQWGTVCESLALASVYNEKAGNVMNAVNSLLDAMSLCGNVDDVIKADINYLSLIIALAKQRKQRPCLIIDHANIILHGGEREDKIVNQFLHLTKETREMNVVLCSSKHSFPTQLQKSGIQLGTVNLVQAEEPPPCAVWEFLTQEKSTSGENIIGMGEKLAKLCIALAGGNVFLISIAVEKLAERKAAFRGSQLVKSVEGGLAVRDVVKNAAARAVLEDLAKVGYVVTAEETTRSLLVEKSVAGLVAEDFTFYTDMGSVVYELSQVLVPSSSGLRNRIAFELHNADSAEDAGWLDTSSLVRSWSNE
jgi:hypothetical protein